MHNTTRYTCFLLLMCLVCLGVGLPLAAQDAAGCSGSADPMADARTAIASGNNDAAFAAYTCACNANRANYDAFIGRMETALSIARFGQAVGDSLYLKDYAPDRLSSLIDSYSSAVTASPDNPLPLMNRALVYWATAQDDLALQDYDAILRLDPNNVFAYLFRASSNQYLGDPYTPPADFQMAINLAPDNADVYSIMGSTYAQTDDEPNALMSLNRALQYNPQDARSYYFRGLVYLNQMNYADAEADFTLAMQWDPFYVDPVYDLGLAKAQQLQYNDAISLFSHAIDLNPEFRLAYLSRGALYYQQSDVADSISDFYQYVELNGTQRMDGGVLADAGAQIQMDFGLVVSYQLPGTAGEPINLVASSDRDQVDPLLVLLDPSGVPIAANDDYTPDAYTAAIQQFSLPTDGMYTLLVTHSDGGSDGAVEVRFR